MLEYALPLPDLLRRSVLLVEDDYFLASQLSEEFESAGAEVVGPVACVSEALELVMTMPEIAVAVLDVDLQGELVYPVADMLVARRVPFVFFTGYDATELHIRYRRFPSITKPASLHSIMSMLTC